MFQQNTLGYFYGKHYYINITSFPVVILVLDACQLSWDVADWGGLCM